MSEVYRLMGVIFPGPRGAEISKGIDSKISTLPGLEGIGLMEPFTAKAIQFLEAHS
jgi:hypothetical protein